MKRIVSVIFLVKICIFACSAFAVNNNTVVVVPLGSQKVPEDANLTSDNIKKGVTIFGVTGNIGIAWGCRYDNLSDKWIWIEDACKQDCIGSKHPPVDCSGLCSSLRLNTDLVFFYDMYFCNGNGGY